MAGRPKETKTGKDNGCEDGDRALIADVLRNMKKKLKCAEFNPSLSEFIRLVQLDREMAEHDPPKEIRVSWSELKAESDIEA